jgi:hypothetical protein
MNKLSTLRYAAKLLVLRVLVFTILIATISCSVLPGGGSDDDDSLRETQIALAVQQTRLVEAQSQPTEPAPPTAVEPSATSPAELATPLPPDTPTVTFTSLPGVTMTPTTGSPMITATVDTNCRAGTSTVFKVLGILSPGDSVPVLGVSSQGFWWYIQNPDKPGEACWVWTETTVVTGDTNGLPKIKPPPTPIPPEAPTATNTAVPATETGN